jgi:hypothetical protein
MVFDSTPDALAVQREVWRRMGPAARVRLAVEISEETRRIALAGARAREHVLPDSELRRRQIRTLYGFDGADPSR